MSDPVEKLKDVFAGFNELIPRSSVKHKGIDLSVMSVFLKTIANEKIQQNSLDIIKSSIDEIYKTSVDEFSNSSDKAELQRIKIKIEEVASELLTPGQSSQPIETRVVLDAKDEQGNTLLHSAIINGHTDIAELFIKNKVGLNVKNNDGNSPLHLAILNDNITLAKFLINNEARLDVGDKQGRTPLHLAIEEGNTELAEFIINNKQGAYLNLPDESGNSPLHLAILIGNIKIANLLIEKEGTKLTSQNNNGISPLHLAVQKNKIELIKLLIKNKVDVNVQDSRGRTPLHWAKGKNELAEFLINQPKVNLNLKDKDERTLLHLAVLEGNNALVELLVATQGVNLNCQDSNGNTPLIDAIMNGNEKIANLFIVRNADINILSNDKRTALHAACEKGFLSIVNDLIKKSKDLNLQNNNGNTPLLRALMFDHRDCAWALINANVNIKIANLEGKTALHIASEKGFTDMVSQFINTPGVNINEADKHGNTPILSALRHGEAGCVKLLVKQGANVDEAIKNEFGEIVRLYKIEEVAKPIELNEFIDEAVAISTRYFEQFLSLPEVGTSGISKDKIREYFLKEIDRICKSVNEEEFLKNPNDYKLKILLDFQNSYLKCLFEEQDNEIEHRKTVNNIAAKFKEARFSDLKPMLSYVHESYKVKQTELLQKQQNASLLSLEILFKNGLQKVREERVIFKELMTYGRFKYISPTIRELIEKVGESDVYLSDGVCLGASVEYVSDLANGRTDTTIQPSKGSRFLQAGYLAEERYGYLLKKKIEKLKELEGDFEHLEFKPKQSDDVLVSTSIQKKLNIKIESTEKISRSPVVEFVQKIESLISKLDTEKSPHFIIEMGNPKTRSIASEHSSHVIYAHLSPPYEIQDVNRPGYSIKTNDLNQFKMYLFFYFLCQAPRDYQEISNIFQVSKRVVNLSIKRKEVNTEAPVHKLLPSELPANMKPEQKKLYLEERDKIYQKMESVTDKETSLLYRNYYLEILDELVAILVDKEESLMDKYMNEYFESKGIGSVAKKNIEESIKKIFS